MRKWWRSCLTTDTWDPALPSKRMVWRQDFVGLDFQVCLCDSSAASAFIQKACLRWWPINQLLQEKKSVGKQGAHGLHYTLKHEKNKLDLSSLGIRLLNLKLQAVYQFVNVQLQKSCISVLHIQIHEYVLLKADLEYITE